LALEFQPLSYFYLFIGANDSGTKGFCAHFWCFLLILMANAPFVGAKLLLNSPLQQKTIRKIRKTTTLFSILH